MTSRVVAVVAVVASASASALVCAGVATAAGDGRQEALDGVKVVGDPVRGARLASSRADGLCVLCHPLPGVAAHLSGDLGPDLAGVGARLDAGALRERLLAPARFNPATVMPSYGPPRADLARVPAARAGRPLLDAQQLEDVVAWLATLR